MTGTTDTITLSGPYLRFWRMDALAFASSRLFEVGDPDHARGIVSIIAYLLSPLRTGPQRWQPHADRFTTYPRRGSKRPQRWRWSEKPSWLDVRPGLPAPRTAACAAKATLDKEFDAQWVVIKALWLSEHLMWHENEMLEYLHGAESPEMANLRLDGVPTAQDYVDPHVIACLPKAGGLIQELIDRPIETQEYHYQSKGLSLPTHKLRLTAMAMLGPLGKRLPTIPEGFGIRNWTRVMKGVFESLWYASSKGIHYRDINAGNIVWIEHPTTGEIIGYLIDYGNARYLNRNRLVPREEDVNGVMLLCEDDARSITVLYQCTSSVEATELSARYIEESRTLETVRGLYADLISRGGAGVVLDEPEEIATLEGNLQGFIAKASIVSHRYIDDLESAIYCFVHQASNTPFLTVYHIES
jgi:hypothetical protein